MRKVARFLWRFTAVAVVGGFSLGACLVALIPGARQIGLSHHYTGKVYKLHDLAQTTTVYDSQNREIGKLGTQFRENVTLDQVPKVMQEAVVAAEDKSFWTNPGIDVGGSFRAFLRNVTSGRIEQGGSTITQQLVKNRLLSKTRDLHRKIRELVLAYRLSSKYTKKEILEQYLNTVYFGQGSYGIKSATERFFLKSDPGQTALRGETLGELDLAQAALLAGLIRNPEADNPFTHPDRARRRRTEVLDAMVRQGYISQAEAEFAGHTSLPNPFVRPPAELRPQNAWVEQAQRVLLSDPRLGATPEERRNKLLEGGLKVYTTLDPTLQQDAQDAVDNALYTSGQPGFGMGFVAMDPQTGFVKAMVDSRPFAESKFNLVTQGTGEQMGSTWKVITLAAALANGYSPNDTVDGSAPCAVRGYDGFTKNAEGGGGTLTIREATAESVNCAFVRISTSVGLDKVADMAQKMGIRTNVAGRQPLAEWRRVLTLTLGVISATPIEMATVTSTIAAGGVRHDPIFVSRVVGADGTVVFDESHRPGERVLAPDVAACETDILQGVFHGTARGLDIPGHPVGAKTGTNSEKHGAAFLGFTPQLAAFTWYGIPDSPNEGDAGFGAGVPGHTWQVFMNSALADQPDTPFPPPTDSCDAPGQSVIPEGGQQPTPAPPPPTQATTPQPTPNAPAAPAPTTPPAPPPPTTAAPPTTSPRPPAAAARPTPSP